MNPPESERLEWRMDALEHEFESVKTLPGRMAVYELRAEQRDERVDQVVRDLEGFMEKESARREKEEERRGQERKWLISTFVTVLMLLVATGALAVQAL